MAVFKKTLLGWLLPTALLVVGIHFTRAAGPLPSTPASPRPGDSAGPVEFSIVVRSDGKWRGEVQLPSALLSSVSTALESGGIRHTWSEEGSTYNLFLEGDDPREIVGAVLEAGCADERLTGPVVLEVSGPTRAGETISIALPGNPSTGYSWAVDQARFSPLGDDMRRTSDGLGSPARQTIQLTALDTGQTRLRLTYRRPWENLPPAQILSIRSEGLSLAETCAALSLPAALIESRMQEEAPFDLASPDPLSPQTLPSAFNWCDQGGCTSVKDQKACGSCWAFATVGTLELALKIQQGLTADLSEQYLVSCNTDGYGCDGGWFAHSYHLDEIPPGEPQAGAVLESAFPYQASDVPCNGPYSHLYRISSWSYVGGYSVPSVAAIKQAINDHGPVAAAVCVGNAFQGYSGGVFQTEEKAQCNGGINHAIVLVGWDDSQQAWILRNSWGPYWGESGYMRIRYGTSNVGYAANYIIYTHVPFAPKDWVYLPLVLRSHDGDSSGLSNGDFESGRDGSWSEYSSNGWTLVLNAAEDLPVSPHGGRWAAWLGGDVDETSILSQRVTIPLDATTLNYWCWTASEDLCGYDRAYVRFGSNTLRTHDLCYNNATGGWVHQQINVAAWQGQTVELRFVAETDESLNSNFFLDDVSLSTTAASPDLPVFLSSSEVSAAYATTTKESR